MSKPFRSLLSLMLVVLTTFLVSCGSPSATKAPPTYTAETIEQIQQLVVPIQSMRDRMTTELADLIDNEDWIYVRNLIHGPLGDLRYSMGYISRQLLPQDQKAAQELAQEVANDLDRIDSAAQEKDAVQVSVLYSKALRDFDAFLDLIPSESAI